MKKFRNFNEFYEFYLAEHQSLACRQLHFGGSACVLLLLCLALITDQWALLPLLPVIGYGFAWSGHFFYEKNKPATFRQPFYSFLADWRMFFDGLRGRVRI